MKKGIQPCPILLLQRQSTGGEKFAVPQTCECTSPGILTMIILENTQALGAD
jgi:hypothetical protein